VRASETKLRELIKYQSDDKCDEQSMSIIINHCFSSQKHSDLASPATQRYYIQVKKEREEALS
jgi:hypothetical protein